MMSRISLLKFICLSGIFLTPFNSSATNTPPDSLSLKTLNGKNFILHKVEPRETWSHLARRYNCTVEELMQANNGIEVIKIDQIVNIPINQEFAELPSRPNQPQASTVKTTPTQQTPPAGTPVIHTVKPGETLFGIAKKYDQPVNTIKELNKLTADGIRVDQKLIIKYSGGTPSKVIAQTEAQQVFVPPAAPKSSTSTADLTVTPIFKANEPESNPAKISAREEAAAPKVENYFDKPTKSVTTIKKGSGNKSMVQVTETGVATWIQDGNQSGNKYFGLHRSAPIGTIVKVTNRMNNASVYVKIVGVLPDTGDNDNVIIKMSQAVSEKLNALDTFFQVELSYGMME